MKQKKEREQGAHGSRTIIVSNGIFEGAKGNRGQLEDLSSNKGSLPRSGIKFTIHALYVGQIM